MKTQNSTTTSLGGNRQNSSGKERFNYDPIWENYNEPNPSRVKEGLKESREKLLKSQPQQKT
jgi:hypothetical protein